MDEKPLCWANGTSVEKIGFRERISRGRLGPATVFLIVGLLVLAGCSSFGRERRCAPPCPEVIHDPVGGSTDRPPSTDVFKSLASRLEGTDPSTPADGKRYNVLAISGGGKYGAFSAGVLNGWTETGKRPTFDVVTGVSTGAIVAIFAYLGPKYDHQLKHFYTTATDRDILRKKPLLFGLATGSLASSDPLKRLIDQSVTPELMSDLAQGHAEGRRLLIGTTNLDTKRLAVWDIGAIAASDNPNKRQLICDIVLASTAVPGQFPAVKIDITIDGEPYTELHVDGGASSEIFLRLAHLNVSAEQLGSGSRPLVGSNLYCLVSGKVFADPECVRPSIVGILGGSVASLIAAMTQNELLRIYTLSLLTGMQFQFTSLPQNFQVEPGSLKFNPATQMRLFEEGRRVGIQAGSGEDWRTQPPGVQMMEQVIPRKGTGFVTRPR